MGTSDGSARRKTLWGVPLVIDFVATAPGRNRDDEQREEGNARFGLESMEGRERLFAQ